MDTLRLCPQCRAPLSTEWRDRLCALCQGDPQRVFTPAPGAQSPAPAPAEIAQYFPQLEILKLWGQGGMGLIYKARQPQLDRIVALKILSPRWSGEAAFAERFSREAQSLARLNHSNIVSIFDFGRAGDFYYFLMEFVDGTNLHSLIQDKNLGADEARRIVMEVCLALQYAHEEGIIHRDIKPANILIDKKGRVKIADFGLARLQDGGEVVSGRPALTTTVLGTPHYIAPEQVETPAAVDHRADLYSLGVVYYEMLTGQLPLGRFEPPSRRSPGLDVRLDEVVLRTLERDPNRRFQNAAQIRAAVETATSRIETPLPAAPVQPAKRHSWRWLGQTVITLATALCAVIIYSWLHERPPAGGVRPPTSADFQPFSEDHQPPAIGRRLVTALQLSKTQALDLNRILRRYQREFIILERRHTDHTKDAAGHVHIVTRPFPEEMQGLIANMLTEFSAILDATQMAKARAISYTRFFPHDGRGIVRVEIWRDPSGETHYVESENLSSGSTARASGREEGMPLRYRSYLPQSSADSPEADLESNANPKKSPSR